MFGYLVKKKFELVQNVTVLIGIEKGGRMSKVYCKNCEFNKSILGIEWSVCRPFIKKPERKNDYYCKNHKISKSGLEPKPEWMHELNKDNDCGYYKRKWRKFWIKKVKRL